MMRKRIAYIIIFTCIVLVGAGTGLCVKNLKSQKIAFYNVPEKTQKAIIDIVSANNGKKKRFITLDNAQPLEAQKKILSGCSILIFNADLENQPFINSVAKKMELSFIEGFPSSIQNSLAIEKSEKGDGLKIIPILYDFYEIDINYPLYQKTGMKNVDVWEDLVETAYREKEFTRTPMVLPFADTADFLTFTGMIAEALCGYEAYEQMLEAFSKSADVEETLRFYCEKNMPLGVAAAEIGSFLRSGIIPNAALQFTREDALFYMDNELSGVNFTTLSQHRRLSKEVADHFTSIYCPAKEFTPERKFAAEQISVSVLKNSRKSRTLAKNLADSYQSDLSTLSGLSPVQKNCAVPDHQADDVRFWLAASKGPVMPLGKAFVNKAVRDFAADYLRTCIFED